MAKNRFGPPSAGQPPVSAEESNNPMQPQPETPPQAPLPVQPTPMQAPDSPLQATIPDEAAGRQEGSGSLSHLQRLKQFKRSATEEMFELKGQVKQQQEQLSQILNLLQSNPGAGGAQNQQSDEAQQLEQYLSSEQVQQQPHLLGPATTQYVKAQMGNLRKEIAETIRQEIGNAVSQERNTQGWKEDLRNTFGPDAADQYSELSMRATEIFKEYQRRYPTEPLTPAVVKLAYWEAKQMLNQEQVPQTPQPGIEPNAPQQSYTSPVVPPTGPEPGQMVEAGSMGTYDASRQEQQAVQAGNWRAGIAGAVGRIYSDRVGA